MRILPIHPSDHSGGAAIAGNWPPAWAAHLAGSLKKAGFTDARFIDAMTHDLSDAEPAINHKTFMKLGDELIARDLPRHVQWEIKTRVPDIWRRYRTDGGKCSDSASGCFGKRRSAVADRTDLR